MDILWTNLGLKVVPLVLKIFFGRGPFLRLNLRGVVDFGSKNGF